MISESKNFLNNLRKKPKKEREGMMWICVIFIMLLLMIFWIKTCSIAKNQNSENNKSSVFSEIFSSLKNNQPDLKDEFEKNIENLKKIRDNNKIQEGNTNKSENETETNNEPPLP